MLLTSDRDFEALCADEPFAYVNPAGLGARRVRHGLAVGVPTLDARGEVDLEAIQSTVDEVEDSLDQFQTVKKKCTNIRTNANEIDELLSEIAADVNGHLNEVRAELSKAEG